MSAPTVDELLASEPAPRPPSEDPAHDAELSTVGPNLEDRIREATHKMTPKLEYIMKAQDLPPDPSMLGATSARYDYGDIRSPSRASVVDVASPTHSFVTRVAQDFPSATESGAPGPRTLVLDSAEGSGDLAGEGSASATVHADPTPATKAKLAESENFLDQVRALASAKKEPLTPLQDTVHRDRETNLLVIPTPETEREKAGDAQAPLNASAVVQNLESRLEQEQTEGVKGGKGWREMSEDSEGGRGASPGDAMPPKPSGFQRTPWLGRRSDDGQPTVRPVVSRDSSAHILEAALKDVVEGYFESALSPVAVSIPPPAPQDAAQPRSPGPQPTAPAPAVLPAPLRSLASQDGSSSYASRYSDSRRASGNGSTSPGPQTTPTASSLARRSSGTSRTGPRASPPPTRVASGPSSSGDKEKPSPTPSPSTTFNCMACKMRESRIEELQAKLKVMQNENATTKRALKDAQAAASKASTKPGVKASRDMWLDASGGTPKSTARLQSQLSEAEAAIKILQDQLKKALEENEALHASADDLSRTLDAFTPTKTVDETLKAVGKRLAEVESMRHDLEGKLTAAQGELEGARTALKELETERDTLKAQAVRLAGENAALRIEAQSITRGTAMETYRARIEELEASNRQLQAKAETGEEELKLKVQLQEAKAQVALLESQLETALETAAEEERRLTAKLEGQGKDAEGLRAEVEELRKQLTEARESLEGSQLEARNAQESLSIERSMHRTELEAKGLELMQLEEEVEEFRGKLRTLIEKMAASEAVHAEANLKARTENEALQTALKQRADENAALREELAVAKEETRALQEQLGGVDTEMMTLRDELTLAMGRARELENISGEMTTELTSLRVERLTLKDQLQAAETALADAKDRLELQGRLWDGAAAAAEAAAVATSTSSGAPEVVVLQMELGNLRAAFTELSDKLVSRERALGEADQQRLALLAEVHRLRQSLGMAAASPISRYSSGHVGRANGDEGDRLSVSSESRGGSPGPGPRLKLDLARATPQFQGGLTPPSAHRYAGGEGFGPTDGPDPNDPSYLWGVLGKSMVLISVGVGPFVLRQPAFWSSLELVYDIVSRRVGSDPLFGGSIATGAAIQITAAIMQPGNTPSLARALAFSALLSGVLIAVSELGAGFGLRATSALALIYPVVASLLAVIGNQKAARETAALLERVKSQSLAQPFSPLTTDRSMNPGLYGSSFTPRTNDARSTPRVLNQPSSTSMSGLGSPAGPASSARTHRTNSFKSTR